jgi:hypothetical protein
MIYVLNVVILYFGIGLIIRLMAKYDFLFVVPRPNMLGLVSTYKNDDTELEDAVSGTVTDVIHGIPGRLINKENEDPMEWTMEKGRELRSLLFHLYGIVWIGPFRHMLKVIVRTFRHGRKEDDRVYENMPQNIRSRFVHFSGEHVVKVQNADTAGSFRIDITFNIVWELHQPVKAILKVGDTFATLSSRVSEETNRMTGNYQPEVFLGNRYSDVSTPNTTPVESEAAKKELVERIMALSVGNGGLIEVLGIKIISVMIDDVSADKETEKVLQLMGNRRRENAAMIKDAEAELAAKKLQNDGEEDYIKRVILPVAREPRAVDLRLGENYRDNKHVTVFAPGGQLAQIIGNAVVPPKQPQQKIANPQP